MKSVLALLSFVGALGVAGEACAQSAKEQRELEKIERQLKDRRNEEKRLRDEAKDREREVAALRQRMIETADALQAAERRIGEIKDETERLEKKEGELEISLEGQQRSLGDALAGLQSIERARPPALLVSPDDAARAARAAMLLADVTPQIEARAALLKQELTALAETRAALIAERAKAEKTNAEIEERRAVLAELISEKQRERRVAQRLAAAAQSETAALAARADSLRDVLSRLDRLARVVAPRLKPAPVRRGEPQLPPAPRELQRPEPFKPARAFATAKGSLRLPVVGKVIGAFGERRPEGGIFDGVRIAAGPGAIVTAPFEGKVGVARNWRLGNLMILDVGGGYHILLMGVGSFLVEEGQTVNAGEPIAAMSGSGGVLDLEIRKNREPVNPSLWLSGNAGGDPAS
jgi:septal ring factor EnvC (AmiA/AmiB activator)